MTVVGLSARATPASGRTSGWVDAVDRGAVDRLYALPPERFVAERRALVAAAESAGDSATAARLARLGKPTVAAWMVNVLALRRPDLIDDLLALGAALRQAQRRLRGEQLRELAPYRREFLRALTGQARQLALDSGRVGATLPLAQVEATLAAALADPQVADRTRAARLTRAVSYSGFGEIPQPRLHLVGTGGSGDEIHRARSGGGPAGRPGGGRLQRGRAQVAAPPAGRSATVLAFDRDRRRGDGDSAATTR